MEIDYKNQDKILNIMKDLDTGFYLTGGTCLHRFLHPQRYSDDLVFFCNDVNLYREYCREFIQEIDSHGLKIKTIIDTRDFVRLQHESLKIDLVNDRVYRYGRTVLSKEGYKIDNFINILSNKITAIVGRDEAKDVFDVCTIASNYHFNWPEVIDIALKKCFFEQDLLIYRLKTFPTGLLDRLNLLNISNSIDVKLDLPVIIEEIITGVDNRLCDR